MGTDLITAGSGGGTREARRALLLVEDDDGVRRGLQLFLQGHGFDVLAFASLTSALADAAHAQRPYVVVDYRLKDGNGIELLDALKARGWGGAAVLITAFPTPTIRAAAFNAGFDAVIDKPFRDNDLILTLRKFVEP